MVLPRRGLTGQGMGCFQAVQPVLGKEGVWPALMICPAATSLPAQAFAEDASQPHPDPAVQGRNVVVWLCLKYSNQPRSVGLRSAMIAGRLLPGGPLRLRADRVLELLQALGVAGSVAPSRTDSPESQSRPPSRRRSASWSDAASGRLPPSIACTTAKARAASSGLRHRITKSSA